MTTSRAFLKRHMATGAVLAVLAAAGCDTEAEPDADASASTPAPAASTTAAASPTPTSGAASSPAPPPSPASETSDAAAEAPDSNSADYESCGDGACEVSFSGSAEFPLGEGDGQWTVEAAFEDDGVSVDLTEPSGMGGGGGFLYHPGCTLAVHADGGGSLSCVEEGEALPEPSAGGIVVHLLERTGDTAVVQAILG